MSDTTVFVVGQHVRVRPGCGILVSCDVAGQVGIVQKFIERPANSQWSSTVIVKLPKRGNVQFCGYELEAVSD